MIGLEFPFCKIIDAIDTVKSKADGYFVTIPHTIKTNFVFLSRVEPSWLF